MAAGYAVSRPPMHPRIMARVAETLGLAGRVERALDVGCGAGLSTAPLGRLARHSIGIEPLEAMLRWAGTTAPGASFAAGRAEALPIRSDSIDLITAAGSLNYADLERSFAEAARVLRPDGVLVVYDFSQGRSFPDSPLLDEWYAGFVRRYPKPTDAGRQELDPEILAARGSGFRLSGHEGFEIGLVLGPAFYLNYAMTEANVAHAVRNGTPEGEIRRWCADTLAPVFEDREKEVLFRGYIAYMKKRPAPGGAGQHVDCN